MFEKIAVCGLGLLGGSLCRSIRKYHPGARISACERVPSGLETALEHGVVDSAISIDDAYKGDFDLVAVATPVCASIDIISGFLDSEGSENAPIVIDVGSVKAQVVRRVEQLPGAARFVGCHPMAGSEKTGYENSSADLYDGASVIITPNRYNSRETLTRVIGFWESLGAEAVISSPEQHDLCVSYTSHLPRLMAALLVKVLRDFSPAVKDAECLGPFIGKGYRDTTRIASGSAEMWRDIIITNRDYILQSLGAFTDELEELKRMIEGCAGDPEGIRKFFDETGRYREEI